MSGKRAMDALMAYHNADSDSRGEAMTRHGVSDVILDLAALTAERDRLRADNEAMLDALHRIAAWANGSATRKERVPCHILRDVLAAIDKAQA